MSLFEDASLIVTPNAVKAGKLYSIKPTDGSGDLSVVRATSATRVDANGLVEIPRTNLVLRSEEFDDAAWTKSNATITSNSIISPSGIQNADTLTGNGTFALHTISQNASLVSGTTYTISVYAKKNTNNFIQIIGGGVTFGSNVWANFDLNNGVVGSVGSSTTARIENAGNGWYRCIITGAAILTTLNAAPFYSLVTSATSVRAESNTLNTSFFLWGAQLEEGVTATEYIPTTSVIRTKFAGITQDGGSASNIARLDYTNGSCPSILVEPQRTNLLLRSEEFDNASWTKAFSGTGLIPLVTSNVGVSPSGTNTADRVILNKGAGTSESDFSLITVFFTTLTNVNYTNSFYLKSFDGTPQIVRVWSINLANFIDITLGSEWVRVSRTSLPISGTTGFVRFGLRGNTNQNADILVWGAQLEAGSNATSYIPTVASAVTRNADVISKTGISDLIGQTEGTIFVDFNFTKATDVYRRIFAISDNTSNNLISINLTATGSAEIYIINGGVTQVAFVANTLTLNTTYKIAVGYIANNAVLYINGTLRNTDLSCTIPTCSGVYLGKVETAGSTGFLNDTINTAMLFKTKLTNSELATLTTL